MKKKTHRKLALHSETLITMQTESLARIYGGVGGANAGPVPPTWLPTRCCTSVPPETGGAQ